MFIDESVVLMSNSIFAVHSKLKMLNRLIDFLFAISLSHAQAAILANNQFSGKWSKSNVPKCMIGNVSGIGKRLPISVMWASGIRKGIYK